MKNKKGVTKRTQSDKYMNILAGSTSSTFPDFEAYLRTVVDLVETDIILVLNEFKSSFIIYEEPIVTHIFKDISEFLAFNSQRGNDLSHSIKTEVDDITMKTKMVVMSGNIAIRFDENLFFSTILGINHNWDFKHF